MEITKSEKLHIAFFGCRNAGKSSLVNAVTNQQLSVVSDVKGTTTDPVQKSMELLPIGPVVIIDTAGLDDVGKLGELRVAKTLEILGKTDIAVLVVDSTVGLNDYDKEIIKKFEERNLPYVVVYNKSDLQTQQISPPLEGGGRGWGKTASHKFSKNAQGNAKELRNNATKQERILWKYINKSQLGYKFRRQQPIGNYIADFFCPMLNLIIELDGGQHDEKRNIEYDEKRTEFLNRHGYRVIRIWNNEIDNNIEGVVEYIKMNLNRQDSNDPTPKSKISTLPQGEGKNPKCCESNLSSSQGMDDRIYLSAKTGEGVNELRELLGKMANENKTEKYIIRDKLNPNDIVILVIPIDESAPKGRIILPQQNVLRECLDAHAIPICCQVEELSVVLKKVKPQFVITDSQVFNKVKDIVPENINLTSFSILMAKYRGKLDSLLESACILSKLQDGDTVLISEACTHHRQCNDIGTVKFPKWIKEYTGKDINFEFTQGGEFPQDLGKYKLIIHCGGCMINETEMKTRQQRAKEQNIPMVNYGMAIAYMNSILDRATKCI